MPLHRDRKSLAGQFDRFNRLIWSGGGDKQSAGYGAYRLVMAGVYVARTVTDDPRQVRIGRHGNPMDCGMAA